MTRVAVDQTVYPSASCPRPAERLIRRGLRLHSFDASEVADMDDKRALLRHAVATVAYRGGKAVRGAPASFAAFSADGSACTSVVILAHIGDLFDWALSQAAGAEQWRDSPPLDWDREVERFHAALQRFDDLLASGEPLAVTPERLFQGAIADALTHVGQLALLRRLAGAKITGENYSRAEIVAGRVGAEQTKPTREFY